MARAFTPKILTANDLLEGDAIYWTADQTWSRHFNESLVFAQEEAADAALKTAQSQPHIAVGAYLTDAKEGPNGPEPVHFREVFRTKGPSNYNHGKQVELSDV